MKTLIAVFALLGVLCGQAPAAEDDALRRSMTFADRAALAQTAAQAKANDYKVTTLVESLSLNDLFQKR